MNMKKFFDDLLKDKSGEKWSLGRVFAFIILLEIVAVNIVTIITERSLKEVPTSIIYLIIVLMGYNSATKYIEILGNKKNGGSHEDSHN